MANIVDTTISILGVFSRIDRDEEGTFSIGSSSGTDILKGTILARSSATGNFIPYVKGGSTNGDGIPKAILEQELDITSIATPPIRPVVGGVYRESKIIIHADGDNSNFTYVDRDALRLYNLLSDDVADNTAEVE